MPLEPVKSQENYVRVQKFFISSADRTAESKGPYDYVIELTDEVQNVVGIEITGWNFPSDIAPTFVAAGAGSNGTNVIDFEVQGAAGNKVFVAYWPEKQYAYENVTVPYLSYVQVLQQIMNQAIAADPDYGVGGANEALFTSVVDPEEITNLNISGTGVTGYRFLFASGTHSEDSAFNAMGWNQIDTPAALNQSSPGRTQLRPFRYFDIYMDQFPELRPVKRIYATNNIYYGSVRNDPSLTRTRLLSSQPLRLFKRVRVRLVLEGGVVPPIFEGREHELTLTVFSVSNEIHVPAYMKQLFVL